MERSWGGPVLTPVGWSRALSTNFECVEPIHSNDLRGTRANQRFAVQPPSQKYFGSSLTQINSQLQCPVPQRGGSRSSRTRGGMRWTRQRWAREVSQIGFAVSDRRARRRTTLIADGEVVWS